MILGGNKKATPLTTPIQSAGFKALEITPLVSLGHALIMDPEWLVKVKKSQEKEIFQALHRSKKDELDIPENLWNMVANAPGWFRVED